jgi:hypothetical protein
MTKQDGNQVVNLGHRSKRKCSHCCMRFLSLFQAAPLSRALGVGASAIPPSAGRTLSAGRFHHFNVSDEHTTLMEEKAIAAPEHGVHVQPEGEDSLYGPRSPAHTTTSI